MEVAWGKGCLNWVLYNVFLLYGRIRKKGFLRTDWIYSDLEEIVIFYRYLGKKTCQVCKPVISKRVSRTSSKTWLVPLSLQGNVQEKNLGVFWGNCGEYPTQHLVIISRLWLRLTRRCAIICSIKLPRVSPTVHSCTENSTSPNWSLWTLHPWMFSWWETPELEGGCWITQGTWAAVYKLTKNPRWGALPHQLRSCQWSSQDLWEKAPQKAAHCLVSIPGTSAHFPSAISAETKAPYVR